MLEPTINHDGSPDSRFFSWLGQFQWVERLNLFNLNSHLLFRTDAQWSREDLLPLEKISIGGSTTVRGYRENQLTGDNGVVASLEWRIPLFEIPVPFKSEDSNLYVAPFFDYGRTWNADSDTIGPKSISSLGLGLRWSPAQWLQTELYWGKALRDISEVEDDDLQDKGVHFEISLQW
jgi:hemolysin activation/secretion protein